MLMVRTRVSTVPVSCATTLGLDQSNRQSATPENRKVGGEYPTDARAREAGAVQHGSTATSPDSRQPARPPAHQASWDDGQTSRGAASSGRRGLPLARRGQNRRAISGPLSPVKSGHSRALADTRPRRSGRMTAGMAQIPKLIARPSSPARYRPAAMPLRACSMVTPNCRVPILAVSSQPPFPAADVRIARRCPLARASFPGARLQLSGSRARLPVWGPWPYAAVAATCAARHVRVGVRALQAPY